MSTVSASERPTQISLAQGVASYYEKFPVSEDVKKFYPAFEGVKVKMWVTPLADTVYDHRAFAYREPFIYAHDRCCSYPALFE